MTCLPFALQKLPIDAGFRITTLLFFTPEKKVMKVAEAHRNGYGIANTATRLLLRSPKTSPETYTQIVSGLHFTSFQSNILPLRGSGLNTCSSLGCLMTCSHTHLFRNYPLFQQHVNVTICCHTPQVAGVPMTVLTASIIFEKKWLVTQIDAAAACPTAEGNAHV